MIINLLVFLLVLGVLVFVHELGHFVAAKACGIYCDRFSLGMPPRLWGFRWGETDYCIGALPIGGYVKMAGQEDAPRSAETIEKEYANVPPDRFYNSKPVWQRAIVIFAGPFMNFVLGVVLYALIAYVGANVPEARVDNRIGAVEPDSPAATAPLYAIAKGQSPNEVNTNRKPDAVGWHTGDRIESINGDHIASVIQDARVDAILGSGKVLQVVIARKMPNGKVQDYLSPVEPKVMSGDEHAHFGVTPYTTALVGTVLRDMPAAAAGFKPGDIVLEADGKPVDSVSLTNMVEKMTKDQPLKLKVQRGNKIVDITLRPRISGRITGVMFAPALHDPKNKNPNAQPVVVSVTPEMEKKVGLKPKDVLLKIDGKPATVALLEKTELSHPGQDLTIVVRQPAILYGLIRPESIKTLKLPVKKVGAIGVVWRPLMVFHREPPALVAPVAFHEGFQALSRTVEIVKKLVTGSKAVRPQDLGGPVMIYQIMAEARQLGLYWLGEMTAFISINLCVFNLLPLPILDGGQLVFLAIEGIRRKPIDIRVLERVQQMGLVFIVLLILFVTFNDIQRLFTGMSP